MKLKTAGWVTGVLLAGVALAGVAHGNTRRDVASPAAIANPSVDARADLERKKEQLTARAATVSSAARARADLRLTKIAARVNATRDVDVRVAERIAKEFGVHTYIVLDQNLTLGATWGELVLAHTLASGTRGHVTAEQLVRLRKAGGMSWGALAAGLGFDLGSAVRAASTEASVARGRSVADGKVAPIRADAVRVAASANASAGAANVAGERGNDGSDSSVRAGN